MKPPRPLVCALLLVVACSRAGSSRSRELEYGSGADVEAILRANGVNGATLACANVRSHGAVIRSVFCRLTLSPSDVGALTAGVPLVPASPMHLAEHYSDSCEATPGLAAKDPGVEVLAGKNTKVPNGASRVELHLVRATGQACVEITYPWSGS